MLICFAHIHVRNYLNGFHEIQNTSALYSIDPLQTREWTSKDLTHPLATKIKADLATHRTKPGNDDQTSFRCEPHLEIQATERLYKDAPPSALILILVSNFKP
jgi:hypothetical protein